MAKMHGKNTRVYLDGYDISGDSNSIEPSGAADVVDVACFSDSTKTYVVGLLDPQIRHGGVYNDAASRIHAIGSGRVGSMVALDIAFGDTQGQLSVGGTVGMSEYSVSSGISAAVTVSASYVGGDTRGIYEQMTSIRNKSALIATASAEAGADMGTAFIAANGTLAGHLQFFSGTGTAVIQSSPDNSTWTNRSSFALATAPNAQRVVYSGGTVPRYWRAGIQGTGTAWVGLARVS